MIFLMQKTLTDIDTDAVFDELLDMSPWYRSSSWYAMYINPNEPHVIIVALHPSLFSQPTMGQYVYKEQKLIKLGKVTLICNLLAKHCCG